MRLWLALGLCLAAAVCAAEDPPPVTGSHADLVCGDCHTGPNTADCDQCHEAKANIHPVAVAPSMALPEGFALGNDGKLLCRTCHRLHGGKKEALFVRGVGPEATTDRRAFCSACHGQRLARTSPHDATRGVNRCAFCHASVPDKATGVKGTARMDIVKLCDFCHNVVAKDHPRNIDPTLSLPKGLPLLPDGSWSCVTCHNPHGTTDTTHFIRSEFARHFERGRQETTHVDSYFACKGCHTTSLASEIRAPGFALRYRGDVNMLCISCHLTDKSHHPTGLAPPPAIRERMDASPLKVPLGPKGGITCYTCHDNNCASGHQRMTVRHYDRVSLRNDLCWICHDRQEFYKTNPHVEDPNLCVRCHESRPLSGEKVSAALVASPKMVCLQCHDVKPHPAGADHLRVPSAKIHPDEALPLGKGSEVTCTTCHEAHAGQNLNPKRLRVAGSELCGRCHWR
ncbi:MAG: cytochrome c3 family protein [Deltaproteobacteria bacterium]|nr:cytochrome c3 family protein [Deltaproteobacteria bacterium]